MNVSLKMQTPIVCFIVAAVLSASGPAMAELQNVEVGGSIDIYGGWYSDFFEPAGAATRIPPSLLPFRAIGPGGVVSPIRAGHGGNNLGFVEQRTRLHVAADFTNDVGAFIELESVDIWGEDFRSNYITGADAVTATDDDIEVRQAFIEARNLLDLPVRLRIGRQEIEFGSGWLVGADPGPDPFIGLTFDAIRLTYERETFSVDAWWAKLVERSPIEEDGDVDFYGIYASCNALDGMVFDLYWLYVRDAIANQDTNLIAPLEWVEEIFGLDDYDVTELHTAGLRHTGERAGFDWEIEVAYQWGESDAVGSLFPRTGLLYGDSGSRFGGWAGHAELGYAIDAKMNPRVYIGGAYYGGEDHRDVSFLEWFSPFSRPQASVSFNRLFGSWREDDILDGRVLSNFWKGLAGVTIAPTERLEVDLQAVYLETVAPFDRPMAVSLLGWEIPVAPNLPFWTCTGDKDLGWQIRLVSVYQYSEDLALEVGWTHFFVGEGIDDGAFLDSNGLSFVGGQEHDDADYVYTMLSIAF